MTTPPPQTPIGGPDNTVGFIFPVYFVGMPRIVKRYIQNLTIAPETYCYAITNYGKMGFDTLGMLNDVLQKKGAHLSYAKGGNARQLHRPVRFPLRWMKWLKRGKTPSGRWMKPRNPYATTP